MSYCTNFHRTRAYTATCHNLQIFMVQVYTMRHIRLYEFRLSTSTPWNLSYCSIFHRTRVQDDSVVLHLLYCTKLYCTALHVGRCRTVQNSIEHVCDITGVVLWKSLIINVCTLRDVLECSLILYMFPRWHLQYCSNYYWKPVPRDRYRGVQISNVQMSTLTGVVNWKCFL